MFDKTFVHTVKEKQITVEEIKMLDSYWKNHIVHECVSKHLVYNQPVCLFSRYGLNLVLY